VSTPVLYVDFETRSPVDLKKAGLKRYAKHERTEVLMMAWAIGDEPFHLWQQGDDIPLPVRRHVEMGGIVVAHNAQFELAIWNFILAKRHGWPYLPIEQARCTMAACYAMSLPGALEDAGRALGLDIRKDAEGRALMLKMCKPKGYFGDVPVYHDDEFMRNRLGLYCIQDGAVEREIFKRVLPLSAREQQLWQLDQYINLRGIPFDMDALEGALEIAEIEKERLNAEMAIVTQGKVTACSAVAALKEWAADYGVMPDSLAKAELAELLSDETLPEPVEKALRLRQASSRFTSISKLKAIKERNWDGRVSYTFQYHAATTGRWAGRGIQPHNFTRDLPDDPAVVEDIMEALRTNNVSALRKYGEPSVVISKCLRGFMHAQRGKKLMGGDFSAIEGRGLAWLAGEEWVLEAYREIDANPDSPDMYERAYAKTFNIDPRDVTKEQRQIGKVEELAFGYQGGVGAFRTMGKAAKILVVKTITPEHVKKAQAMGGQVFTEDQANGFKTGWRAARPKTKTYWYDLERAAIAAVKEPRTIFHAGRRGREVMFRKNGSMLWCKLPSQRVLCYPYPEIHHIDGPFGVREVLTFKGVPDALVWATYTGQKERGERNSTYIVDDPANTKQWCRLSTYGGKLSENITQAICRDLLADAIIRVEKCGFHVVAHVHDEIIVEGDFDEEDRMAFEILMCEKPEWAVDFPMSAGCWLAPRYRKE
jgi:DNA polymerase bacteriophage-type